MAYDNLSDAEKRQAIKDAMSPMVMISLKAKKKRPVEDDDTDEKPQQTAGVGTVAAVEVKEAENKRPAHSIVTVRHGEKPKPEKDKDGKEAPVAYDSFPLESRICLTPDQSKQFTVGDKVRIELVEVGAADTDEDGE